MIIGADAVMMQCGAPHHMDTLDPNIYTLYC